MYQKQKQSSSRGSALMPYVLNVDAYRQVTVRWHDFNLTLVIGSSRAWNIELIPERLANQPVFPTPALIDPPLYFNGEYFPVFQQRSAQDVRK